MVARFIGVMGEQIVRAYNFLWGGHRHSVKFENRFIIIGIGVRNSATQQLRSLPSTKVLSASTREWVYREHLA